MMPLNQRVQGYDFEDITDENQVPNTNPNEQSDALFIPLARAFPELELERMSLRDLVNYLNGALDFRTEFEDLQRMIQVLTTRIAAEEQARQALATEVATNAHNIQLLRERVAALEAAGQNMQQPNAGEIVFGLRTSTGAPRGTQQNAQYSDLPATVPVTFPAPIAENDIWYFTLQSGVRAEAIFSTSAGRIDETSSWQFDTGTRTWTFEGGLTPGFVGIYEVEIIAGG